MSALRGTAALISLAFRRDRYRLPAYVLGLGCFTAATAAMVAAQAPAARVSDTRLFAGNAGTRMLALASGASPGGYLMIRDYLTLAVLAALISAFAVVRHTRQSEETGRAELVGSGSVGRHAGLAAAMIVALTADVVLALALGLVLTLNGEPLAGSLAAGVSVGAVGAIFAAVAAVTAQISSTTRGASGLAVAVLGGSFVVCGVGNMLGSVDADGLRVTSAWPAWLSPIGWGEQMRPFAGDDWRPLGIVAVALAALVTAAAVLEARRDVGRGIFAERRGPAVAAHTLLSPFGMAWRLQRGAALGWAVGLLGFGLLFGSIIGEVANTGGATAAWYARMGGSDRILDAYRASITEMAGMAVAIYVVQMLLRMRADEAGGLLEPVLATAVSRRRWLTSQACAAVLAGLLLLLVFGASMGIAAGAARGDMPAELGALVEASLVQLPGILVIGAVVVALVALLPRWAGLVSWGVVLVSILLGPLFGAATLRLPRWMQDASPFTHTPKVPAVEISARPIAALLGLAFVLAAAGLAAFRRRDLALPA